MKGKYICLRNCFVNTVLWKEGRTYELPDAMDKHPKNFRLVGEPEPIPEPVIESITEPASTDTPEKPREPKPSEYICSKCNSIHREISKVGKKHLKYKEANHETIL